MVRCERVATSAGPEPGFVFLPRRRWSPRLALTPTRVVARSAAGTVELPWGIIARAELHGMPGGSEDDMLGLAARRPGAALWTRGGWLGRLNRRATAYEVSLRARAFVAPAGDVVAAIERYRGDTKRRRRIGGDEECARLLGELGAGAARP